MEKRNTNFINSKMENLLTWKWNFCLEMLHLLSLLLLVCYSEQYCNVLPLTRGFLPSVHSMYLDLANIYLNGPLFKLISSVEEEKI